MASGSFFYDCIRITLFVCQTKFNPDARPSPQDQVQALEGWHSYVRERLRRTDGKKAPDKRTTYRWIDPDPTQRVEPRNHLKQIVEATQEFVHVNYAIHPHEEVTERAKPIISKMCKVSLREYIQLSGIQPFQLRELLPDLAELAQFMFPRTRTRLSYESGRTSVRDAVEKQLSDANLLIYRCRSISETVFRGSLKFEHEEGQTFICNWTDGDGNTMRGNAYVTEDAVCATVIAQPKGRPLNVVFLCIDINSMKNGDVEWGGIYSGLSDGGRYPCSGKMIVIPVSDAEFNSHDPTIIEKDYWGEKEYRKFVEFIKPTPDTYSATPYALSITQTGIVASQLNGKLIHKL